MILDEDNNKIITTTTSTSTATDSKEKNEAKKLINKYLINEIPILEKEIPKELTFSNFTQLKKFLAKKNAKKIEEFLKKSGIIKKGMQRIMIMIKKRKIKTMKIMKVKGKPQKMKKILVMMMLILKGLMMMKKTMKWRIIWEMKEGMVMMVHFKN